MTFTAALLAVALAAPPAARSWADEILYFVLVDRFADGDAGNDQGVDLKGKGAFHGGDLKGLTAHLDEIASLGATALWINPLVQQIPGHVDWVGFPDWGYHGYWADDFTRLDPRFGTEQDLKALVDAAHARGIKVLLDVVYNHCGYGSQYLTNPKTKDWLRNPALGQCGPTSDMITLCVGGGLPDFRTERPEVAKYLLDAQLGWAKRSGVDGFRLDTLKHIDHPFWREHRRRTRAEVRPDFFLIGEVWGADKDVLDPWFEPDEIDAGFDFGFQGSVIGFLLGRGRTVAFNRYMEKRGDARPGHFVSHYLSDHDVDGALFQLGFDKQLFRLAATLEFTTAGIPLVYYGEEVGRAGGKWPDNRSDFPWGERDILPGKGQPRDEALRRDYQKLIAIRKAHPALSRGTHKGLATEGDLYVFERKQGADTVLVAVNRGAAPATARVPAPWAAAQDLLDGSEMPVAGGVVQLSLGPRQARIVTGH